MISDAQLQASLVDQGGRPSLTWGAWFVRLAAALNSLLLAFTVDASNSVTITNPAGLSFGGNWGRWSPALSGSGGMTVNPSTVFSSEFIRVGPIVLVQYFATVTIGGTPSNTINVPMPVAAAGDAIKTMQCTVGFGGSDQPANGRMSGSNLAITLSGVGNYTAGANDLAFSGFYRVG